LLAFSSTSREFWRGESSNGSEFHRTTTMIVQEAPIADAQFAEPMSSKSDAVPCRELPEIAVIVPVYNGRPMLEELCRRLVESVGGITRNFVIVLVDDASPDNPWPLICELGEQDARIKGLRLSRNFGQHYALTAGIDVARARWYVIMDCDLQDAP